MKGLEINVSFIPNLSAVQRTMPFEILYGPRLEGIGGIALTSTTTGRFHVVIDGNATGEEVQDTINWVRRGLRLRYDTDT